MMFIFENLSKCSSLPKDECGCSVVESLTRDQGVVEYNLTRDAALCILEQVTYSSA